MSGVGASVRVYGKNIWRGGGAVVGGRKGRGGSGGIQASSPKNNPPTPGEFLSNERRLVGYGSRG